jgi:phenylalanyl-tRNA synthetase beta subunit
MAFNLVFTSIDRTLNVEEIDLTIAKILKDLRDNLNAELR